MCEVLETQSTLQFKDALRKEKIYNEELRELIEAGNKEMALKKIDKTLQRIHESLEG